MSKIDPLNDVANLQSEDSAKATINDNYDKITAAFENTVSRDGSGPNAMESELDMDDHRVLNVGNPVSGGDAVNLSYLTNILNGITLNLINDIDNLPGLVISAQTAATQAESAKNLAQTYRDQAQNFIGSATSAQKWTTGRSIIMTGDVVGTSPTWDGSTDLTFSLTLGNGTVTGSKLASGAVTSNLGYVPVNKTGDTLTGDVRLSYTATTLYDNSVGYRGVPMDIQDNNYTFVMNDFGRCKRHLSAAAHTYTVPPNSSVPFPIGAILVVRNAGGGIVTIAQGAGVSLRSPGSGTTGNRTLAAWGFCNIVKEDTDSWIIQGQGLS